MSNEKTLATRIETVHSGTIVILDNLTEKAHEFELSEPSDLMEESRRKLVANAYRVLVVGEAKRGKSSFINALIGRNILPINVDIATCQVFRIHRAGQEAYRLRFEDDSTQEIG